MSTPGVLLTPYDPDAQAHLRTPENIRRAEAALAADRRTPENLRRAAAVFGLPAHSAAAVPSTAQNMAPVVPGVTGTKRRNNPRTARAALLSLVVCP